MTDEQPTTEQPDELEQPDEQPRDAERRMRHRAQQAEAERDHLVTRLEAAQRALVEVRAGQRLAVPSALWVTGTSPGDFFTDDGNLDVAAVDAAVKDAASTYGLHVIPKPNPFAGISSARPQPPGIASAFQD